MMEVIKKTKISWQCATCGKEFKTEKAVKKHQRRECERIWISLSKQELARLKNIVRHVKFDVPAWFTDAIGISLLESLGREFSEPTMKIEL